MLRALQEGPEDLSYHFESGRRKYLYLSVARDGSLRVKAPFKTDPQEADSFVLKKKVWIIKQRQKFACLPPPTPAPVYQEGEKHPYLGELYPLHFCIHQLKKVELREGKLCVRVPQRWITEGEGIKAENQEEERRKAFVQKALDQWYEQQARSVFSGQLDTAVCHFQTLYPGNPVPSLKIKRLKRRWGSMSVKAEMVLNLYLIFFEEECLEYVIFHELAHQEQHNHSAAYYAVLDHIHPCWRGRKEKLEAAQQDLGL